MNIKTHVINLAKRQIYFAFAGMQIFLILPRRDLR